MFAVAAFGKMAILKFLSYNLEVSKMEINNISYHNAEISFGYEDVNIIKNALELYSVASKLQYNEGITKIERLRRAFSNLDADMVENLKKALEV